MNNAERKSTVVLQKKFQQKISKAEVQKKLSEHYDRDHELVHGVFVNLENPGTPLRFMFQKYAEDTYTKYELHDGEQYKLPRMVAKHLNNNVHYIKYGRGGGNILPDNVAMGSTDDQYSQHKSMVTSRKVKRCEFRPLSFDDDIDMMPSSNIISVTKK